MEQMSDRIDEARLDGYLELLRSTIIQARAACWDGDVERAEAILDAVHNLPGFLLGKEYPEFDSTFRDHYLEPLVERYPDLVGLLDRCPR
jgi:hypothetical protein